MKEYKKRMPILPIKFSILVYDNALELLERFPDVRMASDPRDFQGGMFEIDGLFYIAFLSDGKLNHGQIAHECKHLVNRVFSVCGIKLDVENDEPECYFLTWVVNEVYKHLKI